MRVQDLLLCRPLVASDPAAEMSHESSGLRITTAKGKRGGTRDSLDDQPGSEAYYSPSASHDASPASEGSLLDSEYPALPNMSQRGCLQLPSPGCCHVVTVQLQHQHLDSKQFMLAKVLPGIMLTRVWMMESAC